MFEHFISASCGGEICMMCWHEGHNGVPATHKVGEELPSDAPVPRHIKEAAEQLGWSDKDCRVRALNSRHNLTAYICCKHFGMIFGQLAKEMCALPTIDERHPLS